MRKGLSLQTLLFLLLCGPLFSENQSKLVILRHGEGEHNLQFVISSKTKEEGGVDHCLTEKGRKQVFKTAQKLLNQGLNEETVGLVLVSPLLRTRQTAQILVDCGVCSEDSIQIEQRIREQIQTDWDGKCVKDLHALSADQMNWTNEVLAAAEHGGESPESIRNRLEEVLHELSLRDPSKGHVILVMHGYPSMVLLNILHGEPREEKLETAEAKILTLPSSHLSNERRSQY